MSLTTVGQWILLRDHVWDKESIHMDIWQQQIVPHWQWEGSTWQSDGQRSRIIFGLYITSVVQYLPPLPNSLNMKRGAAVKPCMRQPMSMLRSGYVEVLRRKELSIRRTDMVIMLNMDRIKAVIVVMLYIRYGFNILAVGYMLRLFGLFPASVFCVNYWICVFYHWLEVIKSCVLVIDWIFIA